jgi:hypothetical protein
MIETAERFRTMNVRVQVWERGNTQPTYREVAGKTLDGQLAIIRNPFGTGYQLCHARSGQYIGYCHSHEKGREALRRFVALGYDWSFATLADVPLEQRRALAEAVGEMKRAGLLY